MNERYERQLVMPNIGERGQARLREAHVLVVGAGGLGSPVLLYLAAAGVGTLGLADGDTVALSNLNRQILYTTADVGRAKVTAAAERLRALNPEINVHPHRLQVSAHNGPELIQDYDLLIEASDNLETKDLMNTLAVQHGLPLVWGAVQRTEGQLGVVMPGHACRRCIFPTLPEPGTYPTPAELGILGATAGVIGALEAMEALKILLEMEEILVDHLLLWEATTQTLEKVKISRNTECPICGEIKD
jgi:adenylyltransferase/sulfurtransferase